jgi:hypothetical protein
MEDLLMRAKHLFVEANRRPQSQLWCHAPGYLRRADGAA